MPNRSEPNESTGGARLSVPIAALTIAGSDSGGGAGIQADLRTFAAHGLLGTSAVTAITAQNTRGVNAWEAVSPALVAAQIDAVLDDLPVAAAKTGMLANQAVIEAVIEAWTRRAPSIPLVVDPVMIATSGHRLLDAGAERALVQLLSLATVVTPNRPEAAALSGLALDADARAHAEAIARLAPRATIVIKGGHPLGPARTRAIDLVRYPDGTTAELTAPWIETTSTHGTGCTFSAAIAANLARGLGLPDALAAAKRYLTAALAAALPLGHGHGPVDHLVELVRRHPERAPGPSTRVARDVLDCIGGTSLVPLHKLGPVGGARILLKLESENPTGSMKDRMALAMIEAAEADGRLRAGGSVVEYTGGSTGVSLALVCATKGYPLEIVSSDAFAPDKLRHMQALGAHLTIVESDGGRMTAALTREMIARARALAAEPGRFFTDQLANADQLGAYHAMAREILAQTEGRVDAFVQCVGSAASLRGTAEVLAAALPSLRVVAVEPAESAVLSGASTGAHGIDGIGAGFVVPLWRPELVHEIITVSTEEAKAMAARLAREEGLFGGTSTGANVVAALRVAARLGPDATVVTVLCDTGMKYLKR